MELLNVSKSFITSLNNVLNSIYTCCAVVLPNVDSFKRVYESTPFSNISEATQIKRDMEARIL